MHRESRIQVHLEEKHRGDQCSLLGIFCDCACVRACLLPNEMLFILKEIEGDEKTNPMHNDILATLRPTISPPLHLHTLSTSKLVVPIDSHTHEVLILSILIQVNDFRLHTLSTKQKPSFLSPN